MAATLTTKPSKGDIKAAKRLYPKELDIAPFAETVAQFREKTGRHPKTAQELEQFDVLQPSVAEFAKAVGRPPESDKEVEQFIDRDAARPFVDIDTLTATALRSLCKERGLKGHSGLNKAGLLTLLRSGQKAIATPKADTAAAMRAELKARGLKGASALNKAQLLAYRDTGEKPVIAGKADGTATEMKAWCRQAENKGKFKGFSTLRKDALAEYIRTGVRPTVSPNTGTLAYYRSLLSQHNIAGRSKAKTKADMIALLTSHGLNVAA
jgi:hypothetical protein